jgi:hypothetical protein
MRQTEGVGTSISLSQPTVQQRGSRRPAAYPHTVIRRKSTRPYAEGVALRSPGSAQPLRRVPPPWITGSSAIPIRRGRYTIIFVARAFFVERLRRTCFLRARNPGCAAARRSWALECNANSLGPTTAQKLDDLPRDSTPAIFLRSPGSPAHIRAQSVSAVDIKLLPEGQLRSTLSSYNSGEPQCWGFRRRHTTARPPRGWLR